MARRLRPPWRAADDGAWIAEARLRLDAEDAWTVVHGCWACEHRRLFAGNRWAAMRRRQAQRREYGLPGAPGGCTVGCPRAAPPPFGLKAPAPPSPAEAARILDEHRRAVGPWPACPMPTWSTSAPHREAGMAIRRGPAPPPPPALDPDRVRELVVELVAAGWFCRWPPGTHGWEHHPAFAQLEELADVWRVGVFAFGDRVPADAIEDVVAELCARPRRPERTG